MKSEQDIIRDAVAEFNRKADAAARGCAGGTHEAADLREAFVSDEWRKAERWLGKNGQWGAKVVTGDGGVTAVFPADPDVHEVCVTPTGGEHEHGDDFSFVHAF